jgi:putative spermidine/putrescine transport system substrate-binding protein
MTIAKNSKNKELAHAYVNHALSQPVQSAFAEELYWGPTNRNVQLSEKAKPRVAFGKERVDKLINPEWDYLLKVRAEWNEWWDRNMAG